MHYHDKMDGGAMRNFDGVELEDLLSDYFEYKKRNHRNKVAAADCHHREQLYRQKPAEEYNNEMNFYDIPYETPYDEQYLQEGGTPHNHPYMTEQYGEAYMPRDTVFGDSYFPEDTVFDETYRPAEDALFDGLYNGRGDAPFELPELEPHSDSKKTAATEVIPDVSKSVSAYKDYGCHSDIVKMLIPSVKKVLGGHKIDSPLDKHTMLRLIDKVIDDACQYDDIEDIALETDKDYMGRYRLLCALVECIILIAAKSC